MLSRSLEWVVQTQLPIHVSSESRPDQEDSYGCRIEFKVPSARRMEHTVRNSETISASCNRRSDYAAATSQQALQPRLPIRTHRVGQPTDSDRHTSLVVASLRPAQDGIACGLHVVRPRDRCRVWGCVEQLGIFGDDLFDRFGESVECCL